MLTVTSFLGHTVLLLKLHDQLLLMRNWWCAICIGQVPAISLHVLSYSWVQVGRITAMMQYYHKSM